jgi:hypothetical protein
MAILTTFLRGITEAGRLTLHEPPPATPEPEATALLGAAHAIHALTIAGPAIPFDAVTALAATQVLYRAAWCFLNPNEPLDAAGLAMPADPPTASHHLSADLVLRYLPGVHRRARALRPGDELVGRLADLLRRWPLSGVLSDVEDGPFTSLDFDGHPGLRLLYAERLAQHQKPAWMPAGPAIEAVELVWQQLGRDTSLLHG